MTLTCWCAQLMRSTPDIYEVKTRSHGFCNDGYTASNNGACSRRRSKNSRRPNAIKRRLGLHTTNLYDRSDSSVRRDPRRPDSLATHTHQVANVFNRNVIMVHLHRMRRNGAQSRFLLDTLNNKNNKTNTARAPHMSIFVSPQEHAHRHRADTLTECSPVIACSCHAASLLARASLDAQLP